MAACTDTADIAPINEIARTTGLPRFEFVRQGIGTGPVTITMPDGEVLVGRYSVAQGGAVAMGSGTAFSPHGPVAYTGTSTIVNSGGNAYVIANGPRTSMTCQLEVGGIHGGGVCRTTTGAEYQIVF